MTLLSMCQQAAREAGFDAPATIIGNTNTTAVKLLAAAQTEGRVLSLGTMPNRNGGAKTGRHDWQAITKEYTFNTVISTEAYTLPTDFRRLVDDSCWDRTNDQPLNLVSPQQWQFLKGSVTATTSLRKNFRFRQNTIIIYPTDIVAAIYFEYVSTQWCRATGAGAYKTAWAVDTDVGVLDEDLMTLGIKWRFMSMLGIPYYEEKQEYEDEVLRAMGDDKGKKKISMFAPVYQTNIPETGYGL